MSNPKKTVGIRLINHHQKPLVLLILLLLSSPSRAVYDLPSSRAIPWLCGSDIWNNGTLPNYTSVTCSGLYADGTRDDAPGIQTCINNSGANTAVYLPAGTYYVNATVRLKSNVVLRGAGPLGTIINLGPNGWLTTQNMSTSFLDPSVSYGVHSPGYSLAGSPQKGDQALTIATGTVNVGDWISVFSDDDPSLVTADGEDGHCTWCADNTGFHLLQQIVKVSAKNGSTVTISKPLYYTLYTNPQYRKYTFPTQYAGFEDFKVSATVDIGARPILTLQGALFCWVKNIETNNTGSSSGSAHVELEFSYGCEVRDSYLHDGRSSASGANYGVYIQFVNSDHKVENNIMRHNRHSIVYQGGGSGTAVLYNYMDDNFTDDLSYLGSARTSHGAHPYMNLFEGNIISHIAADNFWGTSSHFVFFRNWLWGDETGSGVPSFPPTSGYAAVDIYPLNTYYSFVGNVLGVTGMHTTWSAATLRGFSEYAGRAAPIVYSYGGAVGNIPSTDATSINHANYDYKTNGVAFWEGGTDHVLKISLYYSSAPAWWCSQTPWPAIGPDVTAIHNDIPAKRRYDGLACNGASVERSVPMTTLRPVIATYEVFDLKGRQVMIFKGEWTGEKRLVRLLDIDRNLPFGIYLCRISTGGFTISTNRLKSFRDRPLYR